MPTKGKNQVRMPRLVCGNLVGYYREYREEPCGKKADYLLFGPDSETHAALAYCRDCLRDLSHQHYGEQIDFLAAMTKLTIESAEISTASGPIIVKRVQSNRKRKRGLELSLTMNDQRSKSLDAWIDFMFEKMTGGLDES